MALRLHQILSVAIAAVTVAGCGGGSQPTAASDEPPSATAPSTSASTALHGSWRLELTEAEMTTTLTAAGYADVAEEFFASEDIDGAITQVLTIEGGRFAVATNPGPSRGTWAGEDPRRSPATQ